MLMIAAFQFLSFAFSVLTPLVGQEDEHLAC